MRAKAELGVRSKRRGSGRGSKWLWEPPEDADLLQPFKERELADLMDDLIYGDEDPPLPGDEWKCGDGNMNWSDDDEDNEDGGVAWE